MKSFDKRSGLLSLLGASVFAIAAAPAMLSTSAQADNIVMTATVDGTLVSTQTSANGNLDVNAQSFGGVFDLNTVSINSATFLAPPGILDTNTINVDQFVGGTHQLILDIKAQGLVGLGALETLLSSFSVTGQTQTGWTAREQTFINGVSLADTGTFAVVADSAFSFNAATLTNPFTAEAIYTINSSGIGQFNGGVDISVAAVPGPVLGAGIPGALAGLLGWFGFFGKRSEWKRRQPRGDQG